jgi:hypothetical protein
MKILFPTGGRSNLATNCSVMSHIPITGGGGKPIRQNFLLQGQPAPVGFEERHSPATPPRPGRDDASAIGAGLAVPGLALLLGEVIPRIEQQTHVFLRAALVWGGGLVARASFA